MTRPSTTFLDALLRHRYRPQKEIRRLFDRYEAKLRQRPRPSSLQGVHRGTWFKIKVPNRQKDELIDLPSLPPPQSPPVAFLHIEGTSAWDRFVKWMQVNWPLVVLNFGSICTLTGFTRSDVLELRYCSVTGSLCSVVYGLTLRPFRPIAPLWSSLFAAVNSYNIYLIHQERNSSVRLTQAQETMYITHFMPHGITPKQFESIYHAATKRPFAKDTPIIRQGERLAHVFLVTKGHTRANILGRRLSAASFAQQEQEVQKRGTSGAWIGEMAFLEQYWLKEQAKIMKQRKEAVEKNEATSKAGSDVQSEGQAESAKQVAESAPAAASNDPAKPPIDGARLASKRTFNAAAVPNNIPKPKNLNSMYTIVAVDDCQVLQWSHEELEALMAKSTDMRGALTRAMTAAVVGKVINFTVSRTNAFPTWSTWLDDWKHSAAETIEIKRSEAEDELVEEGLPTYVLDDHKKRQQMDGLD